MTFAPVNDPRLASPDAGVRRIAVLDIADAGDDADLPALIAALREDPAAEVRAEAARVLGGWGHPLAVDALAQALLDADADVRANAAFAIAQLKDAAAGECLLPWALHDDPGVRAARALGRLRHPAALPVLVEALAHRVGNLRKEAAIALGEIGTAGARPALEVAASDPDPEVRKTARLALSRLASDAPAA